MLSYGKQVPELLQSIRQSPLTVQHKSNLVQEYLISDENIIHNYVCTMS